MENNFLYIHWDVDPQIIDGFSIGYYNLLFVGGLFLCAHLVKRMFIREKIAEATLYTLSFYCLLGIVLGARLGHCLFYEPEYYLHHPLEMLLPVSFENGRFAITGYRGLASHGGTLGLLIALYLFRKKTGMGFLTTADYLAVVAPLGAFFIRMGNLMNSEIIGKETNVPWAFIFSKVDSIPRHPAQLYEAIAYLILFIVLWRLYEKKGMRLRNGFYFGMTLFVIFTFRFFIEFIKERQVSFEYGLLLDMGQILSIPFMLTGLYFILRKSSRK
jgi:prolipoprotein diacylglyceryl transferase